MKKNRIILIAAVAVFSLAMAASCEKENSNEQEVLSEESEGAVFFLSAESFDDPSTKATVLDNSVKWSTSDEVYFPNYTTTVKMTGDGKAYLSLASTPTPPYFACSPASLRSTAENYFTTTPTFSLKTSYDSEMVDGRQFIRIPLVAYSETATNTLRFQHLSAAVKVMIWNDNTFDIVIDQVSVTTDSYRINGSVTLDYTADNLGMAASYASDSDEDRTVLVTFPSTGSKTLIIPAGDNTKSVQVPILPIEEDDITIEIYGHVQGDTTPIKIFSKKASSPALSRNKMLTAKAKIGFVERNIVNLASKSTYTAQTGDVLTGTAGSNTRITIASGAIVKLRNAKISVPDNDGHRFSAIACQGNATIILEGTNSLTGGAYASGLQAGPTGTTLTIKGEGSLTARGTRNGGAGIGGVNTATTDGGVVDCGNIVIEGGTITAYGDKNSAGIGGASDCSCGNITITGGNVTAYGGDYAAGIGSSDSSNNKPCGDIYINGGTVYAKGGALAAGIGCGVYNRCGSITITDRVTRVTAVKGDDYNGNSAPCSIGKALGGGGWPESYSGYIQVGSDWYSAIYDSPFTYEP